MIKEIENIKTYCNSLTRYSRYKTREVKIGNIPLGGNNPIRIQSMTTTDTMDTKATVEQTIRMVESGCDYVRITAPSKLEAQNLEIIKKELRSKGYEVPLIADIHFTPNAAEIAARVVEKVRVNPGNYADKKKFQTIEYTDDQYKTELDRIRQKFTPLVKICKEYGTAMRIGTNHGSLSDRIMSRYGDTPGGMVESALEFVRICEDLNYRDIVLSMKASNPQVMVQAYRLLIKMMEKEGMNYPLHLGVTEAGGGEDGRIKSALGIGTLLEDGLGDTIRVSLTEDPEYEAPVAIQLKDRYAGREKHAPIVPVNNLPYDPYNYTKRESNEIEAIGGNNVTRVISDFSERHLGNPSDLKDIGYSYDAETDKWNMSDIAPDIIYLGSRVPDFDLPPGLKPVIDYHFWKSSNWKYKSLPLISITDYLNETEKSPELNFVSCSLADLTEDKFSSKIIGDEKSAIVLETNNKHGMAEQRRAFIEMINKKIKNPVIIKRNYKNISVEQLRLFASTDIGGLLIEGFGDGVWVNYLKNNTKAGNNKVRSLVKIKDSEERLVNRVLFNILQAARVRISKTEYIACPSCGRTLFDLQETTDKIRKRTEHLKGIKIAVMGCIVNGPGEMADADYGYVGSGVGKITLYKGKDVVRRNIPAESAVDSLIEIIKEDSNWVEMK